MGNGGGDFQLQTKRIFQLLEKGILLSKNKNAILKIGHLSVR